MKDTIGVIDVGLGNINSVVNMVNYLGFDVELLRTKSDLNKVNKLILPGVGSFDKGIESLHKADMFLPIKEAHNNGMPLMGICLGMQLLGLSSEEGTLPGLGLIDSETKKFPEQDVIVPHMGWSTVSMNSKKAGAFFKDSIDKEQRYYFVHSYYMECKNKDDVFMISQYGNTEFVSAVQNGNLYGFQFHPEKSHKFGMSVFKGFLTI
ncbi:imidazole glycerol phosphate synthase subunit HisH [Pseudoalteromonas sp.]|uniref:imidazole glycerol phosphate synthase subunit HisH n=1 Tax=Pseudoalteromonas sp. TaxID=53249 RepID=UPI00260F5EA3|nr:imidazole glycerol phosphate synthase subunit HisH [Pseudoalteromonas sp.]MCP4588113.1 imidazole glycerol phosphate synthase subunit HisH [Pseudoalteromonas sp.]